LPFEVGVVPFPTPAFSYFSSVEGYAMSSGTQHSEAAWRWMSFLSQQDVVSPHQNQFEATFAATMVPARKSIAERSCYWRQAAPQTAAALKAALDSPALHELAGLTPLPIFDNFS